MPPPDERGEFYRDVFEEVSDAIFVYDPAEGVVVDANPAASELTGYEKNSLIGNSVAQLSAGTPAEVQRTAEAVFERAAQRDQQLEWTIARADGDVRTTEVSVHRTTIGGADRMLAIVRDVTERINREETLRRMYEIGADASSSFDEKVTRLLHIGREYLALPYGFFTAIEEQTQEIVHAIGDHERLQPGETAPLEESYCRKTIEGDDLVGMPDARQELGAADPAYDRFELACYIGTKVRVGPELYGTFCFGAADARSQSFTEGEREIVKLLGQWAGYELERAQFEDRLRELGRVSQELLVAETPEDVAQIAVEAGRDVFDFPMVACWEYDADSEMLRPLAETEQARQAIGETPSFERGSALAWGSFEGDDIRTYADLPEHAGVYNPETDLGSEVHVPLGERGMIILSSTEARAFGDTDIESLRLLGTLLREAMIAASREKTLANRAEALQRQNEQIEQFAGLVAHDLRNPLAGAVGSLEMARETNDPEWFDRAEQSVDRMDALIDELLDITRDNREEIEAHTLSLASTVEEAWSYVDTPEATLSVGDDLGRIHADETRLLQLLANLFRNSVEHAGSDVSVEVGPLPENAGFYVGDDGPGLSDDTRQAIEEHEGIGLVNETGLGLVSVTDMIEAHEWDLSVPETDGGARFEIRTEGSPAGT